MCSRSPCGPLRSTLAQGKLPGISTIGERAVLIRLRFLVRFQNARPLLIIGVMTYYKRERKPGKPRSISLITAAVRVGA